MTTVALAASWLLWSGKYEPLFFALGGLSVVIVLVLSIRMDAFRADAYLLHLLPRVPGYWLWLTREALVSAWKVARLCLDPRLPISPRMATVEPQWDTAAGVATLGNSITFTPGTVTVDVAPNGKLYVHCLTTADAEGLAADEMNTRVGRLGPRTRPSGRDG